MLGQRLDLIGFLSSGIWPKLPANKGKLGGDMSGAAFLLLRICHIRAACGNLCRYSFGSTSTFNGFPFWLRASGRKRPEPKPEIRCEFTHNATAVVTIHVRRGPSVHLSSLFRFYMCYDINIIRREVLGRTLKH